MRALGLDLGSRQWGWAAGEMPGPALLASGTERLPDVGAGRLAARMADRLAALIDHHRVGVVATERPFIHWNAYQPQQVRLWFMLLGVAHLVVHQRIEAPMREAPIQEYRRAFTGDGRADKIKVQAECVARGWRPQSPDEADAMAIMAWALDAPRPFRMECT